MTTSSTANEICERTGHGYAREIIRENKAHIVLPAFEDEARHFGDAKPEATAARHRAAGAGVVVVKDGADPILFDGPEGRITHVPPQVARVVDTTAAGDSFNAGFLAARLTGAGIDAALAVGAALAGRLIGARCALGADAVMKTP